MMPLLSVFASRGGQAGLLVLAVIATIGYLWNASFRAGFDRAVVEAQAEAVENARKIEERGRDAHDFVIAHAGRDGFDRWLRQPFAGLRQRLPGELGSDTGSDLRPPAEFSDGFRERRISRDVAADTLGTIGFPGGGMAAPEISSDGGRLVPPVMSDSSVPLDTLRPAPRITLPKYPGEHAIIDVVRVLSGLASVLMCIVVLFWYRECRRLHIDVMAPRLVRIQGVALAAVATGGFVASGSALGSWEIAILLSLMCAFLLHCIVGLWADASLIRAVLERAFEHVRSDSAHR